MESQRSLIKRRLGCLALSTLALAAAKPLRKAAPVPQDSGPNQLCALHTTLDAKTGRLFIPSAMPFRFSISGGVEPAAAFPLERTEEKPEKALYFAEGEHTISIPSTIKQVYRLLADANPPETKFLIPEIPNYQKSGVTYYGKGMVLTLDASDPVTGVDKTLIALNDPQFKIFSEQQIKFPQDGTFSLRYFSCDRVGNREPMHRLDFKVDVSAPHSSLQVKGNKGHEVLGPNALIALRSQDAGAGVARIQYKIDQNPFAAYENEIVLNDLKPGRHTFQYYAVDVLGNQEATQTFSFAFDAAPPELSLAFDGPKFPDNDITYIAETTHTRLVSSDRDSSVQKSAAWVNEQARAIKDGILTLPEADGLMNLKLVVEDAAGNEARLESKVFLDRHAPDVEAEILGPSYKQGDVIIAPVPLRVRLRAQDAGSGIAAIDYCWNDKPCQPYQDVIEIKEPGSFTLSFQARDRVDHLSEKKRLQFHVKDGQANAEVKPNQEKSQWVSDRTAGAIGPKGKRYRLEIADGPSADAKRFSISIPVDALAAQNIDAKSIQNLVLSLAGYKADIKIPIDGDSPVSRHSFAHAESFQKDATQYFGPGLTVALDAAEPQHFAQSGVRQVFQSVNGASFSPYKEPLRQFIAEQNYVLRYYAVDRVGNREAEHKVEFMLDMTPPKSKPQFTAPYFRNFIARSGGITLRAEDALSGVKDTFFSLDESSFVSYNAKVMSDQLAALSSGAHQLHYYSVDQVANREPTQTLDFIIDDSGPVLTHQIQGSSFQTGDVVFIRKGARIALLNQDKGAGIDQMYYKIGNQAEKPYQGSVDLQDFGRETTFTYRGEDKVKNPGNTRTLTVKLDDTLPSSRLVFQGPYYIFDDKIFVKGETAISIQSQDADSGVGSIYYRINSNDYMAFQKPMTFAAHGEYNFSIYAIDKVGNREVPQIYRVIVDDEKPSLQVKNKEGTLLTSESVLPKGSLLYISAYDSQAGVKDIYYKVGDEDLKLYRQPIRLTKAGPVTLEIKALDWMGEEEVKTLSYRVEP